MIRKIISLLTGFALFFSTLSAQRDEVALVVNGKSIYNSELQEEYNSIKGFSESGNIEPFSSFLDGFVVKKLVIEEALAQRIDTVYQYTHEFSSYKSQLLRSYLQDTVTQREMLDEYSERFKNELNINHAFIPFEKAPLLPSDTVETYKKAKEIRAVAAKDGFDNLETERIIHSFDVVMNFEFQTGNLGWMRSFMLPIELDNIIFSLPLNTISEPIQTSKGYHIFQVVDSRPVRGNPTIEQVMFNFPIIPASKEVQDSVYNVAIRTMDEISIKENFQEVCNEYATVMQRKEAGCLFGEITLGSQIPLPIIKAAFELEKVGDVSHLVLSSYGYHILRLVGKRPDPSPSDIKTYVKGALKNANLFPELLLRQRVRLEKTYNARISPTTLQSLQKLAATVNPNDSLFSRHVTNKDAILLSIANGEKTFTVDDFLSYLVLASWYKNQMSADENPLLVNRFEDMVNNTLSTDVLRDRIQGFTLSVLSTYEKEIVQNKNANFKKSIEKISDGLLYTTLMDKEVWRKSKIDADGLQKTFAKNRSKYKLDKESFKGIIVHSKDKETLAEIETLYAHKLPQAGELETKYNKEELVLSLESGTWVEGNDMYVDTKIYKTRNQHALRKYPYYAVIGKFITLPEDFSDVKSQVEEDYQQELTTNFVSKLKNKYTVSFNDSIIKSIK